MFQSRVLSLFPSQMPASWNAHRVRGCGGHVGRLLRPCAQGWEPIEWRCCVNNTVPSKLGPA